MAQLLPLHECPLCPSGARDQPARSPKLSSRSQEQIAQSLGVKQPSVLKIERQTDLYLSTLRRFVEAAGGTLELRVELPGIGVMRLTGMGELNQGSAGA
jgi:Helix-turn-helix domain